MGENEETEVMFFDKKGDDYEILENL